MTTKDQYVVEQEKLFLELVQQIAPSLYGVVKHEVAYKGLPAILFCTPTEYSMLKVSFSSYCKLQPVDYLKQGQIFFSWNTPIDAFLKDAEDNLAAHVKRVNFWNNRNKKAKHKKR